MKASQVFNNLKDKNQIKKLFMNHKITSDIIIYSEKN
jgi:hypothetical protein